MSTPIAVTPSSTEHFHITLMEKKVSKTMELLLRIQISLTQI